jgi:hypothetical protein
MCDDSIKDKLICLNDYSVMYGELVHKEGVCPKHKFVGKRSINNE